MSVGDLYPQGSITQCHLIGTQNAMSVIEDVVIQNVTPRSLTHPFALFPCPHREKIQFIRTEGTPGLVRLSSDADLVMLLR